MTTLKKLWIWIVVLIVLTPLGLILPDRFHAGDAWGEWDPDKLKDMVGYIPQEMARLTGFWKAPMDSYAFNGWDKLDMTHQCIAYVVAAIVGIAIISGLVFLLGKGLSKNND